MSELPEPISRKKKMIGRIKKGEKVVVEIIAEDLQDKFDAYHDLIEEANRAKEIAREDKSDKNIKQMMILDAKAEYAKAMFWVALHERHGHWAKSVGIRDGYAMVTMSHKGMMSGMPEGLKRMLLEELGESFDGEEEDDD